jgi:hypothetical protein
MLLLAAIAIAAMVAGCGGSGDSAGSGSGATVTTSSLSKGEFVAQASKACQRLRKNLLGRVLAYTQQHESKDPSRAEETALFAGMTKVVLLPTIRKELVALRRLGAPAGEEGEVEALIASEQNAVDSIAKLKHIVSRFEIERYFVESAKLFREYGLAGCANGEEA